MHSELKWFLLLFVGLWLAWLVTGGPSRIQQNRANPFIQETYNGGQIYHSR